MVPFLAQAATVKLVASALVAGQVEAVRAAAMGACNERFCSLAAATDAHKAHEKPVTSGAAVGL